MMFNSSLVASTIMSNPTTGILVSLGLEKVLPLGTAIMMYNYSAIAFLLLLAAFASSKGEARMCIVLPIFAGVFMLFGWLNAPDPAKEFAIVVICGILGIAIYMNEQNRERHGVKGPGNKLMNIVYFLVLFQVATGIVASMNPFGLGPITPTSNMCMVGNSTWGAQCDASGTIVLDQSINSVASSGGLLGDIQAVAAMLGTIAVSILTMLVTIAMSIVAFPVILNGIITSIGWGSLVTNPMYLTFLAGLEAVCIINFTLLVFTWYYKPPLSSSEPL
jgi:hypothetical protein